LAGAFNTLQQFPGGKLKTNVLFTANDIGALKVEVNATAPVTLEA